MNFSCSGKKGDLIMLLYIIKSVGVGNLFLTKIKDNEFEGFEEPLEKVIHTCGQLNNSQSYIDSFDVHQGEKIDINLDLYRKSKFLHKLTLLEVMCNTYNLFFPEEIEPWIEVPKDNRFEKKIVIHRRSFHPVTAQQRANRLFDWGRLIEILKPENCIFVSRLESEWREFGFSKLEYYSPKDNYEHACILKGSKYFVGNQSFPSALADAVGANRIFELSEGHHDRNHFAIKYAKNAWYFANPWDSTIKYFRYLKINNNSKRYLDLKTGQMLTGKLEKYKTNWTEALIREATYILKYRKLLFKRMIKDILGYY